MRKPVLRIIAIPERYFPRSDTLPARFKCKRENGEDYIVESPQPSYEPGCSILDKAVSTALSLARVFPEHRITYVERQNGQVSLKIDPLGGIRNSLSFNDGRAFGKEPIRHWRGYGWGDTADDPLPGITSE